MSFFEAVDPPPEPPAETPPWARTPRMSVAGIIPVNRMLATGERGAIALTLIRAYDTGCVFELHTAIAKPATHSEQLDLLSTGAQHIRAGQPLPPQLLRCGVQYPDGRTATTLQRHPVRFDDGPTPEPPVLARLGGRGGGTGQWMDFQETLWLWPLPPAQTFELVLEWPIAGIDLTRIPIDGAEITAAARDARPLLDR